MLKHDRSNQNIFSINDYYPDWLIYTEISGTASGSNGIIKMSFEVELPWVEDKMPRLKEVDVKNLCGIQVIGTANAAGGKRKERDEEKESEEPVIDSVQHKEDKLQALKERFLKRQKQK